MRRERYAIPRSGPIALTLTREGDREFARLTIPRHLSRGRDDPARAFEVVAFVGRNSGRAASGGKP
jgi:hypothetical protein